MNLPGLFIILAVVSTPDPRQPLLEQGPRTSELLVDAGSVHQLEPDTKLSPGADFGKTPGKEDIHQSKKGALLEIANRLAIELDIGGFEVRPLWLQINADFCIVHQFMIGPDSHPKLIACLAGADYLVDKKAAEACVAKWKFIGLEQDKVYISTLHWRHVKGYTSLSILGEQISIAIRLQKKWETL